MFRETTFDDVSRAPTTAAEETFVMDEETFRGFYDRTARGLWSYLARVTGDSQLADDLLQETFYRFLRASANYQGETHRRNSLYQIATNLARDTRRRKLTQGTQVFGSESIESIPGVDRTGASDKTVDIDRAMSKLKPRDRAILWLAYAEGASHREIATAVGVRPASLKPILFRARKKLAALLGLGDRT